MSVQWRGVTFDWWGTLYVYRDARARRLQVVCDALRAHGCDLPEERIVEVYDLGAERLEREWRAGRVYRPCEWLADTLQQLHVSMSEDACRLLQRNAEEAMLDDPPLLVAGAAALLADLHQGGIAIGLISDTGLTIGRVMRLILAQDGILPYFSGFAFSDEVGVTKPHRRAFECALGQMGLRPEEAVHVGDLPETDICGATAVGMRAVLVTGVSGRQDDGHADAVVGGFAELRGLFREWGLLPAK